MGADGFCRHCQQIKCSLQPARTAAAPAIITLSCALNSVQAPAAHTASDTRRAAFIRFIHPPQHVPQHMPHMCHALLSAGRCRCSSASTVSTCNTAVAACSYAAAPRPVAVCGVCILALLLLLRARWAACRCRCRCGRRRPREFRARARVRSGFRSFLVFLAFIFPVGPAPS